MRKERKRMSRMEWSIVFLLTDGRLHSVDEDAHAQRRDGN